MKWEKLSGLALICVYYATVQCEDGLTGKTEGTTQASLVRPREQLTAATGMTFSLAQGRQFSITNSHKEFKVKTCLQ